MSNRYSSKSENKFKKLRNKDSYMCAFLERRKKAADFAINDKIKSEYDYKAPLYIMKCEDEILELKQKKKNLINSDRNKSEFYQTYNTLKNSIAHKNYKTSNNSSLNKVCNEKENKKYYISKEKKLENKKAKNNKQNLEVLNSQNIGCNNKYNNIKHHTIKVTSESKKDDDEQQNQAGRNYSWKNLQIQKTSSINNYEFVDDNNIKEKDVEVCPEPNLAINNDIDYEYEDYLFNKHKQNKYNNLISIKRENDIDEIIKKYKNKNIINDDSSLSKKKSELNYKNDMIIQNKEIKNLYYPKNMSEPQNVFEKTKSIYSLKETRSCNNIKNKSNNIEPKSKVSEISPIKINNPNEANNKKQEKKYENQAMNSNGINKYENNNQLNNLKSGNNNNDDDEQNKNNNDLNTGYYIDEKISNKKENKIDDNLKQKMKKAGILYKNDKYYIDDLEIPKINDENTNKKDKKTRNYINKDNIPENNYLNKKKNDEDIIIINEKNKENDIQKLNDSNKEKNIITEKEIFSQENKSEKININNNTNFNSNIPKEKNSNNNTKIKNIKAQSYKKFSEGHNYESIKEKFESFLKPREDKEPNIQSKVINSLLTSKEDMNKNNQLGNNNKSLVKNIQDKIKILKENKNKIQNGRECNYLNEIDECYSKIKLKEEKDNLALEEYLNELQQKENENENKNLIRTKENNKNTENENSNKNENNNKKKIIKKSKRLEYIMRNILNNKKYDYFDYHYLSNKLNKSKSKNKENFDVNCMKYLGLSAPDINLIADQSNEENIKLIDENEFTKFRNKNLRSVRTNYNMTKNDNNIYINNIMNNYRNQSSEKNMKNNKINDYKYFSPRLIIKDISHKIMPPNEI